MILTDDVVEAAIRAFGDTEIVGGPPSFTHRAIANAVRVALEAGRYGELLADRDAWKEQHENLLHVRETDIAVLANARDRWMLLAQRTLAYLPSTLGISKEIRDALPEVLPDTLDTLLSTIGAAHETN